MYWEDDLAWYGGTIDGYDDSNDTHAVTYEDGTIENIHVKDDRFRIQVLPGEAALIRNKEEERKKTNGDEPVSTPEEENEEGDVFEDEAINALPDALTHTAAASDAGCNVQQPLLSAYEPVIAKIKGFPQWPAIVLSECDAKELVPEYKSSKKPFCSSDSVFVIFFGTAEVAKMPRKSVETVGSYLEKKNYWTRKESQKKGFMKAAKEFISYLENGTVPECCESCISHLQKTDEVPQFDVLDYEDGPSTIADDVDLKDVNFPIQIGDIVVHTLGAIQYTRKEYHNEKDIFPVGYEIERVINSKCSGNKDKVHNLKILEGDAGPVFRVCVQGKKDKHANHVVETDMEKLGVETFQASNRFGKRLVLKMFGLKSRKIVQLIQQLPNADRCDRYMAWIGEKPPVPPPDDLMLRAERADAAAKLKLPNGIQALTMTWPTNRCAVCNVTEEYDDNLLIQCDKCRLTVHQMCYGVKKAPEGVWMCNICEMGLEVPPPCCVCPYVGGPLKPTTDGRFIHLSCMMWISESVVTNPDLMEPVCVKHIPKMRYKLKCQICKIPYGACVQCCEKKCFASFHPLCARNHPKYSLAVEECSIAAKEEDNTQSNSKSSTKKKTRLFGSNKDFGLGHSLSDEESGAVMKIHCPKHCPKQTRASVEALDLPFFAKGAQARNANSLKIEDIDEELHKIQGCSRATALDIGNRRKRLEPERIAAALKKRKVVKSLPYIVSGSRTLAEDQMKDKGCHECMKIGLLISAQEYEQRVRSKQAGDFSHGTKRTSVLLSMSEKFFMMRRTLPDRLTNGKSAIHGWGAFTKVPHAAGDMMIEYCGDLVRPSVADLREDRSYDKLVGAGTYVFRLDSNFNVDATRAGNMAHLINHSCDPNCYSRTITVNGKNHVVIFALKDIGIGVELSYDYRFSSDREILTCNCGAQNCRGIVNTESQHIDGIPEGALIRAPTSQLSPIFDHAFALPS